MKREIKFRGKRLDNGLWAYGYYYFNEKINIHFISHYFKPSINKESWILLADAVYPETVGMFTGLKDKNGIEVWEGQIRKYNGKRYIVINDGWRATLSRNAVEFGDNEDIFIDEDVAYISVLINETKNKSHEH